MESFATKPMKFSFGAGKGGKEATAAPAKPEMGMESEVEPAESEYTPDELGSVLAEAIKSGSGDAVYEAVAKIVSHCG
jgi:hypothetical protein